ncbi:MAG: glycosyltransferase family 39 protein [Rhodanobacteraceae bacterium]|nr:glycosyltransferase family 39 protein [Rhodanobacteraceae bacterium]MBK7043498.1 glycosyltransferase family 39 protein [Rhodanobacteraceae bacterium]MBP9153860.1 glycosyltransferase family 39 protein [Xanthomonadales bacterium]
MTASGAPSFRRGLILLLVAKLLLAAAVPPFGDEVFYWQEGRQLAAGYSDLPLLTGWLVRAGCVLFGNHLFGMRFGFVLCGFATIVLLLHWAKFRGTAPRQVWPYALALPLLLLSGQLATADAPLTLAFVSAAYALDRALDDDRWRTWLLFGAAVAIAWLAHWRAAMLYPVGLLLLVISPRARRAATGSKFWVAQMVGWCGLLPTIAFNAQHHWAAFHFQAVERHHWTFEPMSLLQPLEQAATIGMLLYPLLLWAMVRAWQRRREPGFDVVAAMSWAIAGGYFLAGLFADAERTRFHWPLPAYLPLLLLLPAMIDTSALRRFATLARVFGGLASVGLAATLVSLRFANDHWPPGGDRRLGEPFLGWEVAAKMTRARLADLPADTVLVADNFLFAAQLDFALQGTRPVYVLDHPRNIKHGRQPQLAIWQRDEAALRALAPSRMLLVVEENALYGADTLPFYRRLCRDFDAVRYRAEHALYGIGKRFVWLELSGDGSDTCRLPPIGLLDRPQEGERVPAGRGFGLSGWALREPQGIDAFEVRVDGRRDDAMSAAYGVNAEHVRDVWPDVWDRHWPNIGFWRADAGRDLAPGRHRIEVRVRADGNWRRIALREIVVE